MKLAAIEDVINRMNISTGIIGSADTIASALEAATTMVESIIQTSLESRQQIDYFSVNYSTYSTPTSILLWLSRGFVKSVDAVYASDDGSIVDTDTATSLDSTSYFIDSDAGGLTLVGYVPSGLHNVAVKYTSGFTDNEGSIPSDIRNAAISAAVYIINSQSMVHSKKDKDAAIDTKSRLYGMVHSFVKERIVTRYSGYYPVRTKAL